jgi:hypothetical protein
LKASEKFSVALVSFLSVKSMTQASFFAERGMSY